MRILKKIIDGSWLEESSDGREWVDCGDVPTKRFVRRCYPTSTVRYSDVDDRGEDFPSPVEFSLEYTAPCDTVYSSESWRVVSSEPSQPFGKYGLFYDEVLATEWCDYLNRTRGRK